MVDNEIGLDQSRKALATHGQDHLLRWWDELDQIQQATLLKQIESIPWDVIDPLMEAGLLRPCLDNTRLLMKRL